MISIQAVNKDTPLANGYLTVNQVKIPIEKVLYVVHFLAIQGALSSWKVFRENVEKQAKEATEQHKIHQRKVAEEIAFLRKSQPLLHLLHRQVKAFRFHEGSSIDHRHLHLPV